MGRMGANRSEALHQPLPVIPGSDLSGVFVRVGPGVCDFKEGEAVFGVTNGQFTGADAEYATASAQMIARKPERLGFIERRPCRSWPARRGKCSSNMDE